MYRVTLLLISLTGGPCSTYGTELCVLFCNWDSTTSQLFISLFESNGTIFRKNDRELLMQGSTLPCEPYPGLPGTGAGGWEACFILKGAFLWEELAAMLMFLHEVISAVVFNPTFNWISWNIYLKSLSLLLWPSWSPFIVSPESGWRGTSQVFIHIVKW